MRKNTKKQKSHILLKGEGINQHTLYGDFEVLEATNDLETIEVKEDSLLRHETPTGEFAEHKTLKVETGRWRMGKQIEYNPITKMVSRVWD
jgi:hypothetical protein